MSYQNKSKQNIDPEMDIDVGNHREIVINKKYEFFYILNEILIGFWFTVGSVFFFWEGVSTTIGIWIFIVGSLEFLIRPFIRLTRNVHLRHIRENDTTKNQ